MHLAEIDNLSINGDSPFHKMRAVSKVIFSISMLFSIILSNSLLPLITISIVLVACFLISKIPYKTAIHLIMYPLFFSSVFAVLMLRQSYILSMIIILKACTAAMTMILLITTTSYVDIFTFLSKFLPNILIDIMLFTYRTLFILLGQMNNLFKSIKLRGGYSYISIIKNLKNIAASLGVLIIHSYEMSERMYQIYTLRGYNGCIPVERRVLPLQVLDYTIIVFSIIIFIGVMIIWIF